MGQLWDHYLVTISGAYLCPVGTIWPLFTIILSQSSQMNICRYTSLLWRRCGRTSQKQKWRQKTSDSLSFLRGRVASLSTFTTSLGELRFHYNVFCNGLQKNDESKFGPKLAFLVNLGQAMQAYSVPCWWVVWWLWRTGCISQDTHLLYCDH